jgi:hypothetical protein
MPVGTDWLRMQTVLDCNPTAWKFECARVKARSWNLTQRERNHYLSSNDTTPMIERSDI